MLFPCRQPTGAGCNPFWLPFPSAPITFWCEHFAPLQASFLECLVPAASMLTVVLTGHLVLTGHQALVVLSISKVMAPVLLQLNVAGNDSCG